MTPAEVFECKIPVAAPLTSKGWNLVPAAVRERSFFICGVNDRRVLGAYHAVVRAFIRGELSLATARQALRDALMPMGFAPPPSHKRRMHDLLSFDRMNSILEMNSAMACGVASRIKQDMAKEVFPAVRTVWGSSEPMPLSWKARWKAAAEGLPCANAENMAAMLHSPAWARLSHFGISHPPFGFRCRMIDESLRRSEALEIFGSDVVRGGLRKPVK